MASIVFIICVTIFIIMFNSIDHLIIIFTSGVLSIILYQAPLKSYIILSSFIALALVFLLIKLKKEN